MANPEHEKILRQGVGVWNEWRKRPLGQELETLLAKNLSPDIPAMLQPDLTGANLSGLNLEYADLKNTQLAHADLSGANLRGAHLSGARLDFANLNRAYLGDSDLDSASLIGATLIAVNLGSANLTNSMLHSVDLTSALLTDAVLSNADFKDANLTDARLGHTVFANTSLAEVKTLDSCKHYFPSWLDYHTIAKSWPLPLCFLRGCGLSDVYIDYLPSVFAQAIQFYSCFISYSTDDQDFAKHLHADLQNKGVRCWFAPHDMQGGKKIDDQIDVAIRVHDRLLLILSAASMASEWVKTEIAHARRKEKEQNRRVLFPIRLVKFSTIQDWKCFDADTGRDSAREIREYYIPNFGDWKENHDSYRNSFERLLQDLKAE